jgi:membrane fusion protein, copper/silver efflux system
MAAVTEVLPYFTEGSRTLKVRLQVENKDYQFRPDMFVDVEFILQLAPTVTVPSSAVIDSGNHAIVYVVSDKGIFEPRFVETGWRFNTRTQILDGLSPDEQIVVSGNFLIDSESRMKLAAAKLMDDQNQAKATTVTNQVKGRSFPTVMTNMTEVLKAIDPICGMTIDSAKAEKEDLTADLNGKTYYFCSEECLEDFHRHGPKIENTIPQHDSKAATMNMPTEHTDHNALNNGSMDMSMNNSSQKTQEKAQDPVCSMDVDINHALSADLTSEYEGTTYYFCSPQCKERFEQSPADFTDAQISKEMPGHEGHIHD